MRQSNIERLTNGSFDVLIIGGGINGAVAAAALAGRGASVALVDRGDFGGFTSQESSNLVWGGFKYLENYEIPLVRNLCMSRNRLMRAYPDNIKEIGFLAALDASGPFPPWLAALGSVAYWGIGNLSTHRPRLLKAVTIKRDEPMVNTAKVKGGIEYFDAYLKDNDARFVFGFVRSAVESGTVAANYTELVSAERADGTWKVTLKDLDRNAQPFTCSAKVVINAAGPFVDGLSKTFEISSEHKIVYSKGIHLVVPQITKNERVLAFFDDTQRLFYVIPMGKRSVIGTTDTRVDVPVTHVTDEDRSFLLEQINARLVLEKPITTNDIISERCGVRPLVVKQSSGSVDHVDWTSLSRKHAVESDHQRNVITIFGGKLTDCLNIGEEIMEEVEKLGVHLSPPNDDWYGEPGSEVREEFYRQARLMRLDDFRARADIEPLSDRLWRRYGVRSFAMLDAIRDDPTMADDIMDSADYLRVELHVAAHTEMVTKLEDFLRRRSKISLVVRDEDIRNSEGLKEVCDILFEERSQEKFDEYCSTHPVPELTP